MISESRHQLNSEILLGRHHEVKIRVVHIAGDFVVLWIETPDAVRVIRRSPGDPVEPIATRFADN